MSDLSAPWDAHEIRLELGGCLRHTAGMNELFSPAVLTGLLLSLGTGLCTGVGAAAALFLRKLDMRVLTFALGTSAGVMVYISFPPQGFPDASCRVCWCLHDNVKSPRSRENGGFGNKRLLLLCVAHHPQ